jgi:hypothetical protein
VHGAKCQPANPAKSIDSDVDGHVYSSDVACCHFRAGRNLELRLQKTVSPRDLLLNLANVFCQILIIENKGPSPACDRRYFRHLIAGMCFAQSKNI